MTTTPTPDLVHAHLRTFGELYDYDTTYLRDLVDLSPASYQRFAEAQPMAQPQQKLTREAHAVACIAVMQREDCGACAQLNLRMAVEAGVARELLQLLLDDPASLPGPLADVYAHAAAVAQGDVADLERVDRLRRDLGDEGFGELAVTITGARIYPTLKRAMGTETHCRKPSLDF